MEKVKIDDDALKFLAEIGHHTTLRYAVQLINPANHLAKIYKSDFIEKKMIKEASELFADAKFSARMLNDRYMK